MIQDSLFSLFRVTNNMGSIALSYYMHFSTLLYLHGSKTFLSRLFACFAIFFQKKFRNSWDYDHSIPSVCKIKIIFCLEFTQFVFLLSTRNCYYFAIKSSSIVNWFIFTEKGLSLFDFFLLEIISLLDHTHISILHRIIVIGYDLQLREVNVLFLTLTLSV